MDICTLVAAATLAAVACNHPTVCRPSEDGKRQFCREDYTAAPRKTACMATPATFNSCRRPDGTTYILPGDAK